MIQFDIDGDGDLELVVAGSFSEINDVSAKNIAAWDDGSWKELFINIGKQKWELLYVNALEVYNGVLYAGGHFETYIKGEQSSHGGYGHGSQPDPSTQPITFFHYLMARWSVANQEWTLFGDIGYCGGSAARAMKVFNNALYVGGRINVVDDIEVRHIVRYDGFGWHPVAGGVIGDNVGGLGGANDGIYTMELYDDGGGEDLYVGGLFRYATNGTHLVPIPVANTYGIARVEIAPSGGYICWSSVNGGLVDPDTLPPKGGLDPLSPAGVLSLAVHDDGSGPSLFTGGYFTYLVEKPGIDFSSIAKFDGSEWITLDELGTLKVGVDEGSSVHSLTTFDEGSGTMLYVGGHDVLDYMNIAKWDGANWYSLAYGTEPGRTVYDQYAFQSALMVGGDFHKVYPNEIDELNAWGIARWTAAP